MPATDLSLGTPGASAESTPGGPGGKMTSGWASPAILGSLLFGMITIFLGLLLLPSPYSSGVNGLAHGLAFGNHWVSEFAVISGGLLVILGILSLLEGHQWFGSVFFGYGAFWLAWGTSYASGVGNGWAVSAFAFLFLLFTLTFLISSFKHGWGAMLALLFLFIAFILLIVAFATAGAGTKVSSGEAWAVGGEWIFTGILWWYGGTARLTNQTYGKRVLPL